MLVLPLLLLVSLAQFQCLDMAIGAFIFILFIHYNMHTEDIYSDALHIFKSLVYTLRLI